MNHWLLCFLVFGIISNISAQKPKLIIPIGHTSMVDDVAFSPDGQYIFTCSRDENVKIWEAKSGREIRNISTNSSFLSGLAISPDGNFFANGGGAVQVWETRSGRLVRSFPSMGNRVFTSVAFSPDGQYLVAGSQDSSAKLWQIESGDEVAIFDGHTKEVDAVAFSPDGKYVLTGSWDHTAKLWEAKTGQEVISYIGHSDNINAVAFAPDGKYILTGSNDRQAKLWDAQTGREIRSYNGHRYGIQDVTFSPDGQFFGTGSGDFTAKLWSTQSSVAIKTFPKHSSIVSAVTFSPDGQYMLTGNLDNTANLWEIKSGEKVKSYRGHSTSISSIRVASEGRYLLTANEDQTAKLWDLKSRSKVRSFVGHKSEVHSASFSADGQYVVTGSADSTAKLWRFQDGEEIRTLAEQGSEVNAVSFSPDGRYILTAHQDNIAILWNTQTGEQVQLYDENDWDIDFYLGIPDAVFSPSGDYLLTANGATIILWSTENGKAIRYFKEDNTATSLQFSPDGEHILSGSINKSGKLWDVNTGQVIMTYTGHRSQISSLAFSSDGQYLLTGSTDGTARLWEVMSGEEIIYYEGHNSGVSSVAFSPDDKFVFTGSYDHTIKLWDTFLDVDGWGEGKELATLIAIDEKDWIVTNPSGQFDASPGAMAYMHFTQGEELIAFEQLKERYYEPDLLEKILGLKDAPIRNVGVFGKLALYPEVELKLVEQKLEILLTERSGGLGRVNFFIGNKEVSSDINPDRNTKLSLDLTRYSPYFTPDQQIQIGIKCWNKDDWLVSDLHEIDYIPPKKSTQINPPTQIYALCIGTSNYAGENLDLNFADKDAQKIAQAIRETGKSLLLEDKSRIEIKILNTEQSLEQWPSKTNIRQAMQQIAEQARPNDLFILYISGHGTTNDSDGKDYFYYLTHELNSGNINDTQIRQQYAISTAEFAEWLTAIPAQKQVLMLDACASGTFNESFDDIISSRDIPSSQIRALDRLRTRTGLFIISGSTADQVSYEASQFGQGLLTYSLLHGIKSGEALRDEQYVDVLNLFSYAKEKVPELAEQIGGIQEPMILTPYASESYDIGRATLDIRNTIELSEPKPIFSRVRLNNKVTMDDDLGLEEIVNAQLREFSKMGTKAQLLYVNISKDPSAYRIGGGYQITDDQIILNIWLKKGQEQILDDLEIRGNKKDLATLSKQLISQVYKLIQK